MASQQRPAARHFRVEASLVDQGIEAAMQPGRSARLSQPAPQQRREAEPRVGAHHLRIDHQPGFKLSCQHVLVVQVPVSEQSSGTPGLVQWPLRPPRQPALGS
jgi:hypothetical protein